MKTNGRTHKDSFRDAASGLIWALKTQPNFRIHIGLSAIAILLGILFGLTSIEMTIIVFTILLGLITEMLNTSVEAMTDLITTEYRENAKIAKDVAAGMMLLTAIGAVVIACFIFLPHLLSLS